MDYSFKVATRFTGMESDAKLPDVALGPEEADGGRDGGREVWDLAVGGRRKLKVEEEGIGNAKDLK